MKVIRKVGFFTAFIIPSLVIVGYYLGGYWNFLAVVYTFIFIPIIDYIIGLDTYNVPDQNQKQVGSAFYYRLITYCWVYFQIGFFIWGTYVVAMYEFSHWIFFSGFILSFALVTGGIGITVAHELGHKNSKIEQFYSQVLLLMVGYMHFFIEHNQGHHVWVATPQDPATARKGQSFYHFWIQSVFLGYWHAWKIELSRMKRNGWSTLSYHNRMIWFSILPALLVAAFILLYSWLTGILVLKVGVFIALQSLLGFTLLELVNYIEHYGMRRKMNGDKYERVTPLHSWNASHMVSNFFLFQLQRHSDHHANAIKRYQILNHYDESPQLPAGYPTMILMALVPIFWFKVMDRQLSNWQSNSSEFILES